MRSRLTQAAIVLLVILVITGCSGTNGVDPVMGGLNSISAGVTSTKNGSNSHYSWGYYGIAIDTSTLGVNVLPLRTAEFNANVTRFMQPPTSPTNRISVAIDSADSDFPNGIFAVDVTLHHPFPGFDKFSGFDVRGIFMSNESYVSQHYDNLGWSGSDESVLLNADGWTRFWNWPEFTTYNTIFGYTQGMLSTSGFAPTATLNPYKYFADGIEAEDELIIDPSSRGFFSVAQGANTRRYLIQFPTPGPQVVFAYAVDASWSPPDPDGGPIYEPDDWDLDANTQEAFQITVASNDSTVWWQSGTEFGGDLNFTIGIHDWQATQNSAGILGEISAIWIESPTLFDTPVDIFPSLDIGSIGATFIIGTHQIPAVTPTGLSGQQLMIAVESASPTDYAPQIDGISGFIYPEEPLAAYYIWDVPIHDSPPDTVPAPENLVACVAGGVVELYWDEVIWVTLDGYNLYRKLSTEPSYDFGSPLNSALLTDPEYIDLDVLDDGTAYDYVAKAVDISSAESEPSNEVSVTPQYVTPSGYTDLESPDDGEMGSSDVLNGTNVIIDPDGNIYLVWDYNFEWPEFQVKFVMGDLNDGTFGTEITVGDGDKPDVAFDSQENAHVAWGFGSGDGANPKSYYYAMVAPDGTVSDETLLHTYTYGNWWSVEPTIAVTPDDEIHVVFIGFLSSTGYGLLYTHGTPGNFTEPAEISENYTSFLASVDPDLICDSEGNLHMTWVGSGLERIMYMMMDTDGIWSSEEEIVNADDTYVFRNYRPGIAVDRLGVVHVSWSQESNSNTNTPWYANNRTGSFDTIFALETEPITNGPVQVACDGDGNAYVIWYRDLDPDPSLHDWKTYISMVDRSDTVVQVTQVNEDPTHEGVIPSITGLVDPCWDGEADVIGFWTARGNLPPQFARLRPDY